MHEHAFDDNSTQYVTKATMYFDGMSWHTESYVNDLNRIWIAHAQNALRLLSTTQMTAFFDPF